MQPLEIMMNDEISKDDDNDSGVDQEEDGIYNTSMKNGTAATTSRNNNHNSNIQQPMMTTSRGSNICRSRCICCFRHVLNVLQTLTLLILIAAVFYLYLQLKQMQVRLDTDEELLQNLNTEVQNQEHNQQDITDELEQEQSYTIFQMAGTFTLLSCLITAFHMTQHIRNFHEEIVQRKIVAILWMSPIYSITSWLSLVFPKSDAYLAVIKDLYEAYVIYTFLSFLIAVLGRGNRDAAVSVLARHADHLHPPTRCLSGCYHPPPETSDKAMASAVLLECQLSAMQFVLVRPVTSIFRCVNEVWMDDDEDFLNEEEEEDPYAYFKSPPFFISMVTNVSVFFAFNGLLKFYHVVREDLLWCRPFSKFVSIKAIVFLTFWQGLLISIIVSLRSEGASAVPNNNNTGVATSPPMPTSSWVPTMAPVATVPTTDLSTPSPTPSPTMFEGATIDVPTPTTIILDDDNLTDRFLYNNFFESEQQQQQEEEEKEEEVPPTNDEFDDKKSARERASQIQNFLICLEMLFFSLAHWCVFPAEEWEPNYRPKSSYAKPGIALKDFASDISYMVSSSARAYRRTTSSIIQDDDEEEIIDDAAARNDPQAVAAAAAIDDDGLYNPHLANGVGSLTDHGPPHSISLPQIQ